MHIIVFIYIYIHILYIHISAAQPESFLELGQFGKSFVRKCKRKRPHWKNFGAFPRYSQSYILNGRFNQRMDTIRAFCSKIRALFLIFKKEQERPPP